MDKKLNKPFSKAYYQTLNLYISLSNKVLRPKRWPISYAIQTAVCKLNKLWPEGLFFVPFSFLGFPIVAKKFVCKVTPKVNFLFSTAKTTIVSSLTQKRLQITVNKLKNFLFQ